jgi:DHA3 family macrolide efflux protein-like MFS transporter
MKISIPAHPAFRLLFAASLVSLFSEGLFILTAILLVKGISNNVTALSWMFILTVVPSIVLAPFAGAVIDRFHKGSVAMVCQLAQAVLLTGLAILLLTKHASLVLIYATIILNDTFYYVLAPTTDSLTRELLGEGEYVRGESFMQGAWQVGNLVSSFVAGALLTYFGSPVTLLCAAMAHLAASIILGRLRRSSRARAPVAQAPTEGWLREIREGWRYVRGRSSLRYAALAASLSLPIMQALNILIAPFNEALLHGNPMTLGIIDAAVGLGGILSATVCVSLAHRQKLGGMTLTALVLLMISLAAFVSSRSTVLAVVTYTAVGTFVGVFKVLSKSIVYRNVETAFVGRTMTSISMVSLIISIPVALLIGHVAERSIPDSYFMLIGFMLVPITLVAVSQRKVLTPASVPESR